MPLSDRSGAYVRAAQFIQPSLAAECRGIRDTMRLGLYVSERKAPPAMRKQTEPGAIFAGASPPIADDMRQRGAELVVRFRQLEISQFVN